MRKGRPISQIVTSMRSFISPCYTTTQVLTQRCLKSSLQMSSGPFFEIKLITMCNGKCCTGITNPTCPSQVGKEPLRWFRRHPGQFAFTASGHRSAHSKNTLQQITYIRFISCILDNYTIVQVFAFLSDHLKAFNTFITTDIFYSCGTSPDLDSHTGIE